MKLTKQEIAELMMALWRGEVPKGKTSQKAFSSAKKKLLKELKRLEAI